MSPHIPKGVLLLWASLTAMLSGAGIVAAQPFPPEPPDQKRAVAGWLVEYGGESDGGRIVRLTRAHHDYMLEYQVSFWRGNAGPYSGISVAAAGDSCGGETWQRDREGNVWRAEDDAAGVARNVRARLVAALVECGARPGEAEAALVGFDRAFALAAEWTEIGRVATLAEIEAIVNYGSDAGTDANAAEPR